MYLCIRGAESSGYCIYIYIVNLKNKGATKRFRCPTVLVANLICLCQKETIARPLLLLEKKRNILLSFLMRNFFDTSLTRYMGTAAMCRSQQQLTVILIYNSLILFIHKA